MPVITLHGVPRSSNSKQGKNDIGQFDSEITLDEISELNPESSLFGSLSINSCKELKCYGIRIQLDATVYMRFQTKNDNRLNINVGMESIFHGSSEPKNGHYIQSPFRQQILGDEDDDGTQNYCFEVFKNRIIRLEPGEHQFPFQIRMPKEPLPAPFKSQSGSLYYKIVAYMRSPMSYVQVAETILKFRGYNNLSLFPDQLLTPVQHEIGFSQSMFSSKKSIKAILKLEKVGFLPGEELQFRLLVQNSKLFVIRKVNVTLMRRVIYIARKQTKTTTVLLSSFDSGDDISNEPEIVYTGKLDVPMDCVPSFNSKPNVYSVRHWVQFQVKTAECPGPLRGEVEVIIGTTRDSSPISQPQISSQSMNVHQLEVPASRPSRERSRSINAGISEAYSDLSLFSQPPAYSQLSSRTSSMTSLQTLPPHYDDLNFN